MRVCPFCSTENEAFFRYCLGCGANLDEAVGEADEPAVDEDTVQEANTPAPPKLSSNDTAVDLPPITPSAGPEQPAPARRERRKTLDPGGPIPPGGASAQALAQARHAPTAPRPHPATEKVGAVASSQTSVKHTSLGSTKPASLANPKAKGGPGVGVKTRAPAHAVSTTRSASGAAEAAPPRKRPAATKARLIVILEDGSDGTSLELGPESTIIGREDADISFPNDDFLAKRHAELRYNDGTLFLKPLPSTNGVFLQVHQEVELDSGDVFRIGQQLLRFEVLSVVAATLEIDPRGQAIPLGSPIPEGAWGRLGQVIAPDALGSVYLLGGSEVYLGRERGDITFPGDGFVSGLHAQISMRNGRFYLKDLGSSNGSYLRLSKPAPVRNGMLVLAGQQLFRVES